MDADEIVLTPWQEHGIQRTWCGRLAHHNLSVGRFIYHQSLAYVMWGRPCLQNSTHRHGTGWNMEVCLDCEDTPMTFSVVWRSWHRSRTQIEVRNTGTTNLQAYKYAHTHLTLIMHLVPSLEHDDILSSSIWRTNDLSVISAYFLLHPIDSSTIRFQPVVFPFHFSPFVTWLGCV